MIKKVRRWHPAVLRRAGDRLRHGEHGPAPGTALTLALSGSILDASDIALTGYSFTTSSGVQF
jgi:hypothetical protein